MSEYQYYEFVAIDEPLTLKQMAELRSRSSRATITPTRFVNDYEWGNFKGDPVDWMRRYFDAHVYVANWCTCCLLLRVPKEAFDARTLRAFRTESVFSFGRTDTHWLLEWTLSESEDYARFGEDDGRDWMGRLLPLRNELLRGDLRPLYLGWLAGVSAGEVGETATEPGPPRGLSRLTGAQRSLAEFLEVDQDLLKAAGTPDRQSPEFDVSENAKLDAWLAELPLAEKTASLKLLLTERSQQAERKLNARLHAWRRERQPGGVRESRRRTVAEMQELATSITAARKRQEAAEHERAEAERRAKHETHLRTLAADFDRCWQTADGHAERGIASAYDEVRRVLVELAEAYTLCASRSDFDRRLEQFMGRHGGRAALASRLSAAGLWKKLRR